MWRRGRIKVAVATLGVPMDSSIVVDQDTARVPWAATIDSALSAMTLGENAELVLKGEDATFSGIVRSEADRMSVHEALASLDGVENTDFSGLELRPWKASGFRLSRPDGSMVISGQLQTEEEAGQLRYLVRNYFSESISDQLVVDRDTQAADWLEDAAKMSPDRTMEGSFVKFEFARHELLPKSYGLLDQIAGIIINCRDMLVVVEGHTDNIGADIRNQPLSERRAGSVMDYLVRPGYKRRSARGCWLR